MAVLSGGLMLKKLLSTLVKSIVWKYFRKIKVW